jgi:hypothetical protein
MRRALILAALLACGFATPTYAQDDAATASCIAQNMSSTVRPLLQQAMQFSPQGMNGSYVPLTQPFAPPAYGFPGLPPGPPTLAPPTAQYNLSAAYTGLSSLPPPGTLSSQQIAQFLVQSGRITPGVFNPNNAELLIALSGLQQTEAARQQQQALINQQQGQYLNSLYQLSASYQVTSLDWQEAYSGLASSWMNYITLMCRAGADAGTVAAPAPSTTQNQPVPTYPAGNYPGGCGAPGFPCLPPGIGR